MSVSMVTGYIHTLHLLFGLKLLYEGVCKDLCCESLRQLTFAIEGRRRESSQSSLQAQCKTGYCLNV